MAEERRRGWEWLVGDVAHQVGGLSLVGLFEEPEIVGWRQRFGC